MLKAGITLKGLLEMRYMPSDKYTIAWFKLAECVARGERERALGVYRLLIHSFDDSAFARQLEADIVLAFDDKIGAIERYKEAAHLYIASSRLLEAAAVYEHVLSLSADKQECLTILFQLYIDLGMSVKAIAHLHPLFALALGINDIPCAQLALERLEQLTSSDQMIQVRQQMIYALLAGEYPQEVIVPHIKTLIDGLLSSSDQKSLQQFLSYLQGHTNQLYQVARSYIENRG